MFKFGKKFQEFTLSRNGEDIIKTENYFNVNSSWFKKSEIPEFLLNLRKENILAVKSIISGDLSEKKIQELLSEAIGKIDFY